MKELTANEVLKKINFPVELQDVFLADGRKIDNHKTVIRKDINKPLSIVTDRYNLLDNKRCFSVPLEVITSSKNNYLINRYSLNKEGETTVVDCLSKDDYKIPGNKKDEVYKKRVVFVNSYNRRSSLKMLFGAWRLICENGAGVFMESVEMFRIVHAGNREPKIVKDMIMKSLLKYDVVFKQHLDVLSNLSNERVNEKELVSIFERMKFGKRVSKNISDILSTDYSLTLLGIYGAVTQYLRNREISAGIIYPSILADSLKILNVLVKSKKIRR